MKNTLDKTKGMLDILERSIKNKIQREKYVTILIIIKASVNSGDNFKGGKEYLKE